MSDNQTSLFFIIGMLCPILIPIFLWMVYVDKQESKEAEKKRSNMMY